MHKKVLVLLVLCSFSSLAWSASGDVCRTAPHSAMAAAPLTDKTVFVCPNAGSNTISQLYQKGWRVVQAIPQMVTSGGMPPSGQVPTQQWMIIVEKL